MPQVSYKSYLTKLLLFSIAAAIIVFFWNNYSSIRFKTNLGWEILSFFILINASIHFILTKTTNQDPKKFVFRYMAISGLKLFGFLLIILVYALFKREEALGFTLLFLTLYLIFSAFEAISLLNYFKK